MPRKSAAAPPAVPAWRNRVLGLEYHLPGDLQDHHLQWRTHPATQLAALTGVLGEVGIAGALLAYRSPAADGALVKIDGHARAALDAATPWPTLILDVTDAEAALLLASHDPLAALAETNSAQLAALLHDVQSGEAAVQSLLSQLAQDAGIVPPDFQPVGIDEQGRLDEKAKVTCPACGEEFAP